MEEKNKPLELALDLLKHTQIARNNEYRYINPDFGIVISFAGLDSYLFKIGQPYRTKEGRLSAPYEESPYISQSDRIRCFSGNDNYHPTGLHHSGDKLFPRL